SRSSRRAWAQARDGSSSRPCSSAPAASSSGSRSRWPSASRSGSDAALLQRDVEMERPDVDGLNAGYAALLLEQYLDNPSAVPSEWRARFESAPEELLPPQPALARLLQVLERNGNGGGVPVAAAEPAPAQPPPAP